jgi:hypothetical protein
VSAYALRLVHGGYRRGNFAGERLKGRFIMGRFISRAVGGEQALWICRVGLELLA